MRIMGFSAEWAKLHLELPVGERPTFTTFRVARKDRDWEEGEWVQVYFKPRTPSRKKLGEAVIIHKDQKSTATPSGFLLRYSLTEAEAQEDGFKDRADMFKWLRKAYGVLPPHMNKLTLQWVL